MPLSTLCSGSLPDLRRRILLLEVGVFLLVAVLVWLDELLDLPHRLFGTPSTPVNLAEGFLESGLVLLLGAGVICLTLRLLRRLRTLEGLLSVCSFCKRIRTEDRGWTPLEDYLSEHSAATCSHGVCPECAEKHYRSQLRA